MGLGRRILVTGLGLGTVAGGYWTWSKYRVFKSGPAKQLKDLVKVDDFYLHWYVRDQMTKLRDFPVREDDVFVVTFPKSGTTWVQEIVYLIITDLDFKSANSERLDNRSPFLEFPWPGLDVIDKMESPRVIKTHMPRDMLPKELEEKKPKIIYVARNPRDVSVSFYYFLKRLAIFGYKGDFNDFFEEFMEDRVPYGPWWRHVSDFWQMRDQTNLLFITYEEMHQNNHHTIQKIARFLGKPLTEDQVEKITEHCRFDKMACNKNHTKTWLDLKGINKPGFRFFRKGEIGDWRNHYTDEMVQRMDTMAEKVCTSDGKELKFIYDGQN